MRGPRRFVRSLLSGRRPRRFQVDGADVDALRVAIEMRAARPGSGAPREEFVGDLYRRLAKVQNAPKPDPAPAPIGRRLVLGGALAATGAAAGAAIDRAFSSGTAGPGGGTLIPDSGAWHPILAAADLPESGIRAFDTGAVTGFVSRREGRLRAVSGICTHQECRLHVEAGKGLRCPCHGALFALDGTVLHHRFPRPLRTLPRLAVREANGMVQVYVPPASTFPMPNLQMSAAQGDPAEGDHDVRTLPG